MIEREKWRVARGWTGNFELYVVGSPPHKVVPFEPARLYEMLERPPGVGRAVEHVSSSAGPTPSRTSPWYERRWARKHSPRRGREGRAMTLDQSLDYALRDKSPQPWRRERRRLERTQSVSRSRSRPSRIRSSPNSNSLRRRGWTGRGAARRARRSRGTCRPGSPKEGLGHVASSAFVSNGKLTCQSVKPMMWLSRA